MGSMCGMREDYKNVSEPAYARLHGQEQSRKAHGGKPQENPMWRDTTSPHQKLSIQSRSSMQVTEWER